MEPIGLRRLLELHYKIVELVECGPENIDVELKGLQAQLEKTLTFHNVSLGDLPVLLKQAKGLPVQN